MGCASLFIISSNFYAPQPITSPSFSPLALIIKGNKIEEIGNLHDLRSKVCATTKIVKAERYTVLPGFIDGHTHMIDMGWRGNWIDLSNVKKLEDLLFLLTEVAKNTKPGEWILGHSWDESQWIDEKRFPSLRELDSISDQNPIYLRRVDGHIAIANTLALQLLKIPENTPIIEKDKEGRITGVIKERALEIAEKRLKAYFMNIEKAIDFAFKKAIEKGITSVTEYLTPTQLALMTNYIAKKPRLYRIAAYVWIDYLDQITDFNMKIMHRTSYIKFNGVKLMVDGSIGARTAALREPYKDDPSNKGILFFDENELNEIVRKADKLGYQLSIHAIGDRAIDVAISALRESRSIDKLRHRIEHFEMVKDEHVDHVKKLKIPVSMQPNFVANWQHPGGLYEKRLGWERAKRMNPFKTLFDSGIIVGFGSDCMPLDPLYGIYGALTHPIEDERLTLEEAIRAYTLNSAYLEGNERFKGSLERGKIADIIILDRNLKNIVPKELINTAIKYTIIGGSLYVAN